MSHYVLWWLYTMSQPDTATAAWDGKVYSPEQDKTWCTVPASAKAHFGFTEKPALDLQNKGTEKKEQTKPKHRTKPTKNKTKKTQKPKNKPQTHNWNTQNNNNKKQTAGDLL